MAHLETANTTEEARLQQAPMVAQGRKIIRTALRTIAMALLRMVSIRSIRSTRLKMRRLNTKGTLMVRVRHLLLPLPLTTKIIGEVQVETPKTYRARMRLAIIP
jgi:hydrogenase-4 membrane subunit HyfE